MTEAGERLPRVLLRTGLYTLLATALCLTFQGGNLAVQLFRRQDLAVLLLGAFLLLVLARWRPALPPLPRRIAPQWPAAAAVMLVLLVAWAGTWLVFGGYPLTRDELLADFDAAYLAQGMLLAPVAAEWQPYAHALMPQFMLPLPASAGWLSAYLPGNAALRAIGSVTIGADWVNPILAAECRAGASCSTERRNACAEPLVGGRPSRYRAAAVRRRRRGCSGSRMPKHDPVRRRRRAGPASRRAAGRTAG